MSAPEGFRITFDPPIRDAKKSAAPPLSLEGPDWRRIDAAHPEINISFHVEEQTFGYYPGSVSTAVNDVWIGWEQARLRKSGDLSLAGYPVLEMYFEAETAWFSQPRHRLPGQTGVSIAGRVYEAGKIERVFEHAAAALWKLTRA